MRVFCTKSIFATVLCLTLILAAEASFTTAKAQSKNPEVLGGTTTLLTLWNPADRTAPHHAIFIPFKEGTFTETPQVLVTLSGIRTNGLEAGLHFHLDAVEPTIKGFSLRVTAEDDRTKLNVLAVIASWIAIGH